MNLTKVQKISAGAAFALIAMTGIAAAQTVPTITVTPVQPSVAINPGTTGGTVSTITLTGNQAGTVNVASIPITLTGGVSGNLQNCQAFSSGGTAISTGAHVIGVGSGNQSIVFDTPLTLTGTSPTTITLRCNVSATTTAGTMFGVSAGTPVFVPEARINLVTSTSVVPGQQNAVLALVSIDATRSGQGVRIASLPLNASFTGVSNLTSCQLRNINNVSVPLNSGNNTVSVLVSGTNTFTLDTPLVVSAGTAATLALTCNVSSGAPLGGTVTLSVNPATVPATSASTGAVITPAAGGPSGTTGITQGTVAFSTTSSTPTPTTPGVPSTGSESMVPTLLASALALIGGAYLYLRRRFA